MVPDSVFNYFFPLLPSFGDIPAYSRGDLYLFLWSFLFISDRYKASQKFPAKFVRVKTRTIEFILGVSSKNGSL